MTLKTSLLITGDASVAQKAVDDLKRGVEALGASGKAAAAGLGVADKALEEAAQSARAMATAQADAGKEMQGLAIAAASAGGALGGVVGDANRAGAAVLAGTAAVKKHTQAANDNAAAMQRHAAGARNLGQQFGDLAIMIQGGIDPARAFATQAGQMGYAMSEMGGRVGKVGAFLVGPWGIALTIAASVLAPFIQKLIEGGEAADDQSKKLADAAQAADSYGNAQSLLGKVIDLTTGKLKTQNAVLIQTIKLQAQANILAAQKEQRTATGALRDVARPTFNENASVAYSSIGSMTAGSANVRGGDAAGRALAGKLAPVRSAVEDYIRLTSTAGVSQATLDKGLDRTLARIDALARVGKLAGRDAIDAKQAVLALGTTLNDQKANRQVLDALSGKGVAAELTPYERGRKPPKPKKPPSTEARDEFGRDASTTIAGILDQFGGTPPVVRQVNAEVAKLDDLIDDLGRKKPPNFEKLIADARTVQAVVVDGLQRPYLDFIADQQAGLEVQRLITAGRLDEAAALQVVQGLQKTMGPLTIEQKDAILATTQAIRAEQRELERRNAINAKYLEAIGSIRDVLEDATQSFVRGDLGQFLKSPGMLLDAFQTLQGRTLFDNLFDGLFSDLEDEVTGANIVKDASEKMATAVDHATASIDKLGASVQGAADRASAPSIGAVGATPTAASARPGGALKGIVAAENGDIIVNGRRDPFSTAIGKLTEKVSGAFTSPQAAANLGRTIGTYSARGLEGAATGTFVAGIGKSLGLKMSSTGAQIGGAIGSFVPIPGGQIIGSVLGGLVGGLFKSAKTGSATIGAVNGQAGVSGTGGNNAGYTKAATGLAGSINDSIESIIDQLGGTLGSYAVSIGQRDKKFVVDASGRGSTKFGKANDGITAYDSSEEAAAAALIDAVRDGAVAGISGPVAKALQSSTDVNRAVREALKVQDVELLLGGIVGQYQKAFRDFEGTAKERVRIAGQYGFDVLAIEKRNADDRAKLADELARAQVGSLKSLVDELTSGSLFEGSALEKVTALNASIAKAKADLEAGVEGAGDQLASLYEQRIGALKSSYGTTSGFATGRNETIAEAQAAIARVNAQVAAAQTKTSDPALSVTNAALDENNDQNARIIAALEANNALLARFGGGGGSAGFDLTRLASV